ncbi:hypothetical protein SAZ11_27975 [Streptomyces sp. FXJ1.4098]|uniref:DUF7144 family membrane protein n=1 Tax=Streptomyces sp. NPDC020845 TaxID=3365096 RepID=UPI00299CD294|nr:hypothetical protein [Streptomyces sp. FXJ1.4098]
MASHVGGVQPQAAPSAHHRAAESGWIVFAAVMMIFAGLLALSQGISAIRNDQVFVVTRHYAFAFDLTGWGWVHAIVGALAVVAGAALFTGAMWARVVGVVLAGLSLIANFLWLPYYPVWAVALLILDALVIWALCTGPGMAERAQRAASMQQGQQGQQGQGPPVTSR